MVQVATLELELTNLEAVGNEGGRSVAWGKVHPLRRLAAWMTSGQRSRERAKQVRGAKLLLAFRSSANGLATVAIYFADIYSDIQVMLLLYRTNNLIWATEAAFFLVAQYVAVYLRVLAYLNGTFGAASWQHRAFLVFGLPVGVLLLDLLMFLEPFGLLAILPLPETLKQFIPAYKATRIIAEVTIESMPQVVIPPAHPKPLLLRFLP